MVHGCATVRGGHCIKGERSEIVHGCVAGLCDHRMKGDGPWMCPWTRWPLHDGRSGQRLSMGVKLDKVPIVLLNKVAIAGRGNGRRWSMDVSLDEVAIA